MPLPAPGAPNNTIFILFQESFVILHHDLGFERVIEFDRNGYLYHGVVKALADGARKAGVEF